MMLVPPVVTMLVCVRKRQIVTGLPKSDDAKEPAGVPDQAAHRRAVTAGTEHADELVGVVGSSREGDRLAARRAGLEELEAAAGAARESSGGAAARR